MIAAGENRRMNQPTRLFPAALAAAALGACLAARAASPAAAFTVFAPGTTDPSALPRELRAAPVCDEKPVYPRAAYRKGLEGLTVLRATVGTDGRIQFITVFRTSGDTVLHRELDTAAAAALASCHWDVVSPASFDHPVDVDAHYRWVKAAHENDF